MAEPESPSELTDLLDRYRQQAGWTQQLRANLLAQTPLPLRRVLEVGCGPGAVTATLHGYAQIVFGLDLHLPSLRLARRSDPPSRFCAGDALALPYREGSFDAAVCHFLLLWLTDPSTALAEMARVTRPGGTLIAFAEPDYGARIDYPPPLDDLGRAQTEALRRQGAQTSTGRALAALFHAAGLQRVQYGLLGGQWQYPPDLQAIEMEWRTLEKDLQGFIPGPQIAEWRALDLAAWQQGRRVLFVPTFYAIGWLPV